MIYNISSKDNLTIKQFRQLKRKNQRTEQKRFIAEGRKIVMEAFENVTERVFSVVMSESFAKSEPELIEQADKICNKVYIVPQAIFDDLSDTETPQGILAVLDMCENESLPDGSARQIVVLDGVSEPGNLGTVIRTAEALGFDGIYLMKGSADIYSPKTVRSTMGSIFRMKFKTNCNTDDIRALKEKGLMLISTSPAGETILEEFSAPQRFAVVIGNEAHGVSDEILKMSDCRLKISMEGMAESLNAAVASGIVMHWLKTNLK